MSKEGISAHDHPTQIEASQQGWSLLGFIKGAVDLHLCQDDSLLGHIGRQQMDPLAFPQGDGAARCFAIQTDLDAAALVPACLAH
ncbi:MAG TPA: hypothetical protein VF043_39860 [Ktedonobacteraceae bacterium]